MAKVSFSALIEHILGKLAGSVFQDSYGGYQVRTRVTPRNPQSQYQQLRRGAFGYISSLWRNLTPAQRGTFIAAAASTGGGLNLFVESNVNLSLVLQPIISSYIVSLAPVSMPISIVNLTPPIFTLQASGTTTTVPAGMALLIFSTAEKFPSKIFTNPSQYSPILSLPAGTDLSIPINISAEWIAHFGQFTADKRICVKSALINIINGKRTDSLPVCAIEQIMPTYYKPISQFGVPQTTVGTAVQSLLNTALPANALLNIGDKVLFSFVIQIPGSASSKHLGMQFNGNYSMVMTTAAARNVTVFGWVQRTGATDAKLGAAWTSDSGQSKISLDYLAGINFTLPLNISIAAQCPVDGSITADSGWVDIVNTV